MILIALCLITVLKIFLFVSAESNFILIAFDKYFSVFVKLGTQNFLRLWLNVFHHFWKIFNIISSNVTTAVFFYYSSSEIQVTDMLDLSPCSMYLLSSFICLLSVFLFHCEYSFYRYNFQLTNLLFGFV